MNILDAIKKDADSLKGKYHLRKIGVFGSRARGEEREGSDIDVLVEFEEGHETFDNYMDLKFFLEDSFGAKVDLVTADAIKPQLKDEILGEVRYA